MNEARLKENLERIREAVARAARRVGRDPSEVRIVAVTKGQPPEVLRVARAVGLQDLGENRVQELEEKVRSLGRPFAVWHMVGHVQSRKAKEVAALADWVHSLDSLKLARRLSAFRLDAGSPLPILVQVNTSGEGTKSGFSPEEVLKVLPEILELPGLRVQGFMTMAPLLDHEPTLRACFRRLRELHEEAGSRLSHYTGKELSMGMSNDFSVAVEEGSTMIRIGTALFGEHSA